MKRTIAIVCTAVGLMSTSASAMDICVQENGGCKNLRTGTVYLPEGNKWVDPETKQVFTEDPPVQVKINIRRGSGDNNDWAIQLEAEQRAKYAKEVADETARRLYRDNPDARQPSLDARQKNGRTDVGDGVDNDSTAGVSHDPLLNQGGGGQGVDPAKQDFDVRMKAKRDYQKQQIPGFITHQPTDAHERGVYKQEMNRQKNMDPNTWDR